MGGNGAGAGGSIVPVDGSAGSALEDSGSFLRGDAAGLPPVDVHIVVDQFGYLPDGEKVAVMRSPQMGFDAAQTFAQGATYAVVDAVTGAKVKTGAPSPWNGGAIDATSGDRAAWFDFSDVTAPGDYYVLDVDKNARSFLFRISRAAYRDVLKQAARMLFYQRAGQEKDAAHAGAGWADKASHVGPLQDHHARLYSAKGDASTDRDLWGGWYDAGDYNKYTNFTASYVENLLRAYVEHPAAFTDDFEIPESGNGIPDILDEARWGMDFLTRMQGADGSVLSIVGEAAASPPSAATGQSLYGSPSTATALSTAAAFAYGSRVYRTLGDATLTAYADDLLARAKKAWSWAQANPSVMFFNNDQSHGTAGLGAGQQQPSDTSILQLDAAVQLFAATQDATYSAYVDANYAKVHFVQPGNYVAVWNAAEQEALLDYLNTPGATPATVTAIRAAYMAGAKSNLAAMLSNKDPYLALLDAYVWGSNSTKAGTGSVFYDVIAYRLDAATNAGARRAAERYVHYLHGVNPLALVYLTNMGEYGAENSVNELFHSWFTDGSARWDRVGTSTYGPPPGFLTGGPNPGYDWDPCCPSNCGSTANNAVCMSLTLSPPKGQPAQKSYKDFNTPWPLDSWSVTEPDDGYQIAYIRLLSKFVN